MCYLLGPEHNFLRPWVFHPTVARGAVGFKSNGWQLGSAGLVKFPFAELTMWWSDWPFISIFYRHKSKLTILLTERTFSSSRWSSGGVLSQVWLWPPCCQHLTLPSRSYSTVPSPTPSRPRRLTARTRPSPGCLYASPKPLLTHFVSRWAAGSTLSSASSQQRSEPRLSGEIPIVM